MKVQALPKTIVRPESNLITSGETVRQQQRKSWPDLSSFDARLPVTGPALLVPVPQQVTVAQQASRLKSTLEDVEKMLALAKAGHPVFGAMLEALEGLPEKLKYELARLQRAPGGDVAPELTPFVKQELETAQTWLGQLDWSMLGNDDHGLAEDLAWDLRAALPQS